MRKLNLVLVWTLFMSAVLFSLSLAANEGGSAVAESNYLKISKAAIGRSQRVEVGLNKSMVIDLPGDAHDILVANPSVADAITRTARRIYIFAKQVGTTNIFIFDSAGNQLLSIDLEIERDITGLEDNLKKYVPGSDVIVEIVNDNIVLTGTVPTPQASSRVLQLAQAFLQGGEATTNQFQSNSADIGSTGSTVIFGQESRRESQIVNLLRIEAEDQVHLKVTIAEIQRTIVKQLGIDLTASGLSVGNIDLGFITDNPLGLGNIASAASLISQYTGSGGEQIDGILRAMDQAGVMRTLAEPSLTAISGETASFRVGGEYNLPDGSNTDADTNQTTLSFRQVDYGVSLSFTPVVLGPGRISLRIATEVSEPTTEGAGVVPRGAFSAAATLPGVRRREASTTVELPSGGSMVLAGLLKDDVRQAASGFPGLSKIPVLGTLFRSRDYQRFESELVIIATPYLVRPIARKKLARPDDNFAPVEDGARNFLGRLNKLYGNVQSEQPKGQYHGKVGFIFK